MPKPFKYLFFLCIALIISACEHSLPEGVEPVENFDVTRYMGKWYEIARLENRFERGLIDVTAEYSLNKDMSVNVINSGTDEQTGERKVAEGRARSVRTENLGLLKVSFFGPFYSAYGVFELGENYDYAFVSGANLDYLWLLAREPQISEDLIEHFQARALSLGFELDDLVFPQKNTLSPVISTEDQSGAQVETINETINYAGDE